MAALGVFMSGPAQTYGVSVFVDPMLADLGWSRSGMSGAYGAATLAAGVSMLVFGRSLDRVGARRAVTVLAALYGLACLGMAAVASPTGLIVGFTALRVLGSAALTLSCTTLAALWFVRWRGRAVSVTVLGIALSNAVMPPALHGLVSAYGWRTAWLIVGLFVWAALIVPAWVLLRDRPEAIGLHPDGYPPPAAGTQTGSAVEHTWALGQAVRTRTFWLLVAATLAPAAVQTGLTFHQVSFFASRGLPAELAASVLSIYAVAFALASLAAGRAIEKVPERHLLVGALLLLAAAVFWLMTVVTATQAVVYGVLLGVAGGVYATTSGVLWAAYYGRRHLGSIRGVTQSALAVSAAAGPLMLSLPFDLIGSYGPGLWLMAGLPLACAAAARLAGPPQAAPVGTAASRPGRPVPSGG